MKQPVSLICVFALLATFSLPHAFATTPGSVQPIPEEGESVEEPGELPESPELPEESPDDYPEEAPNQPEYPSEDDKDQSPPQQPQQPQRPQRPQRPVTPPQRPQRPLPPQKPERPEYPTRPEQPQRPQRPSKPGRPRPPQQSHSEIVQIRKQFLGQANLPLYLLTNNLLQLQGFRLVGLTINGLSQNGFGGAFFCSTSGCSQIQPVGGFPGSYRIATLGEPIDQFSGQWFLSLQGNFAIETIQLEFVR